jgi:hypothetical protein
MVVRSLVGLTAPPPLIGQRLARKFTATADGRYRQRYDLGIIRRRQLVANVSKCERQLDRRALALFRTAQMSHFGTGHLGNCGTTRSFSLCVPAELLRASKASKGRACCSKSTRSPFSRHNPELGIRPVKWSYRRMAPSRLLGSIRPSAWMVADRKGRLLPASSDALSESRVIRPER